MVSFVPLNSAVDTDFYLSNQECFVRGWSDAEKKVNLSNQKKSKIKESSLSSGESERSCEPNFFFHMRVAQHYCRNEYISLSLLAIVWRKKQNFFLRKFGKMKYEKE
jgi:hypothetical protein